MIKSGKRNVLPDVGRSSVFYNLIYWPVYLYFNIYYRKFTVTGRENIPAGKPVIFAGNHQNALMDALSILFAARGKVVFLARADLFRRKLIARILFLFRILPVYRIRDGISEMAQNEATFVKAAEVLRNGTPLALFPEGNHAGFKKLRSLKKGICRIAFMAEEKSGFNLDLHIVPSGIDYSNYSYPGSRLLVKYGQPIPVRDFIPQYRENPQRALSALRDRLSAAMEPLMINIGNDEHYEVFMGVCGMYRNVVLHEKRLRNNHHSRLLADRDIIRRLDESVAAEEEQFRKFSGEYREYAQSLEKYGLRDWLIRKNATHPLRFISSLILSLVLLPLFLYGLILNYLPYKFPSIVTRKVKDQVFHSSIHFGIGLIFFPLYYLLLQVLFSLFVKSLILRLLFAFSLPVTGVFTFYFYKNFLKTRGRFRLLKLRISDKQAFDRLFRQRKHLISRIRQFIQVP